LFTQTVKYVPIIIFTCPRIFTGSNWHHCCYTSCLSCQPLCHQCMYSICMLILNKIMLSWNVSVSSVKQLPGHLVYGTV
jgi:hypothetical protein